MNIKDVELEIVSRSCSDYVLYYSTNKNIGFEAQFDNNKFNGIISFCENLGDDHEEWEVVKNRDVYHFIKEKAIKDFEKIVKGIKI